MKKCTKCGNMLPESMFSLRSKKSGKLRSRCKECRRQEHITNRDHNLELMKKYNTENKERLAELSKLRYSKNKDEILKKQKNYYESNKEAILKNHKEYRDKNPDKMKLYKDSWRDNEQGGIYMLYCRPTDEVYFGQSSMLNERRWSHFSDIRNKCHDNPKVRELSKTYSEDNWEFIVLILEEDYNKRIKEESKLIFNNNCLNIILNKVN